MQPKRLFLFLLLFLSFQIVFSQEDTIKKDSSEVYQNIQTYSKKNKFTKLVHRLVFKPINPKINKEIVFHQNYQAFQGKIIRNINIQTLDPFGYSELDSIKKPRNWAEKNGNRIHIKTKRVAIRNALLIRKNTPFDSLLVKESARLIRSQSYINRVSVRAQLTDEKSDSVDVFIRVLDTWSLLPRVEASNSKASLQLNERNFLGSGHTFNNQYQERYQDRKSAYKFEYIIPNIKNSFIQTHLNYFRDLDNHYGKTLAIDRPFYSPFAKWAGGIYLDQQFRSDSLADANLVYAQQNFKYNTQDYWLGHAFKLSKENTENSRATKLIISGRFLKINYLENPTIAYDSIHFYSSETFFLSGIGISTRKFVQDKYIFKNGMTEDVPIGKIYGMTGGYQFKNHVERLYLGGQISYGNYFHWGFFSFNAELGSFFERSITNQTAFSLQVNYFTNLINIGKWKVRQFVKPQLLVGINRENSSGDQLSINNDYGIKGFNSAIYGNQKAILTLQTQTYSPWSVLGFRLNPFFNYSIAMIGNENSKLQWSGKPYSKIGFGFIINNDFLVFRTFQISVAFYPTIPGSGNNIVKTNAFETSDFGFQNFELNKPRTVIYK